MIVEDASYGFVRFEPGYLSCSLKSQQTTDVSLAIVHLAPDLNGWRNWATVGTLDGAQPIDGLGDEAGANHAKGFTVVSSRPMAENDVTVFFNPRCSKCRTVSGLLEERGIDAELIEYLQRPPTRADLERVLRLLGTDDPRSITRTGEDRYRELGLDGADREAVLDALAANPVLIERPIVVVGDRAVVARPPERLLELLD